MLLWVSFSCSLTFVASTFVPPTAELTSCEGLTATIVVSNASDSGLVYMRTHQGYTCMHESTSQTTVYTFPFEECSLLLDVMFTLVIQRKKLIQTAHDVQLTYHCGSTQSISISDISSGQLEDSNMTVRIERPEVSMTLTKDGEDVSGGYVKLGDVLTLEVEIINSYNTFDVSPKVCIASVITLINNSCLLEEEIFPGFNMTRMGRAVSVFKAFRPTTGFSGAVNVIFTCTLRVCLGWCSQVDCNINETMATRRKREATDESEDRGDPSMSAGTSVLVGMEDLAPSPPKQPLFCIPVPALGTILVMLCLMSAVAGVLIWLVRRNERQSKLERVISQTPDKPRPGGVASQIVEDQSKQSGQMSKPTNVSQRDRTVQGTEKQRLEGNVSQTQNQSPDSVVAPTPGQTREVSSSAALSKREFIMPPEKGQLNQNKVVSPTPGQSRVGKAVSHTQGQSRQQNALSPTPNQPKHDAVISQLCTRLPKEGGVKHTADQCSQGELKLTTTDQQMTMGAAAGQMHYPGIPVFISPAAWGSQETRTSLSGQNASFCTNPCKSEEVYGGKRRKYCSEKKGKISSSKENSGLKQGESGSMTLASPDTNLRRRHSLQNSYHNITHYQ